MGLPPPATSLGVAQFGILLLPESPGWLTSAAIPRMERRFAVKTIRRKNKNGTQIDATAKGAAGASVEVSHPKWVNAVSQSKTGSTGLILQNGTKLENDFKAGKRRVEFSSGLTLETAIVQSAPTPMGTKRTLWYTLGIPGLASFHVVRDTTGVPYINIPPSTSSASAAAHFKRLSVHQFTSRLDRGVLIYR